MVKYSCLRLVGLLLLLTGVLVASAQQDTLSPRQKNIRNALGMNLADFQEYQTGMKQYGQRLLALRTDTQLGDSIRAKTIVQLHREILIYQQQHLTAEQLKRLQGLEQNDPDAPGVRHRQQLKELEERMQKKGIRETRDSIH